MKRIIKLCFMILPLVMLSGCYDRFPQERLSIIIGLGYDLQSKAGGVKFKDVSETFTFKGQDQIEHQVLTGEGDSIYSTQDDLQSKFSRKFILGSELVYLIGEHRAAYGIEDLMDSMMRDVERRRIAAVAVSRQSTEDVYKMNPMVYSTVAEDIYGNLKFSWQENFFSRNIQVSDLLKMYHQEGREIVIPYISVSGEKAHVVGLALFNRDKMITNVDLKEAKLINMLRNNNSSGHLDVKFEEGNKYYEGYFKNKVKVKVSKEDDALKYSIFVKLTGNLKVNTVDEKAITKKEVKEIQKKFSEKIKKELATEIKKIQQVYKIDWLDLGQYAVAKYGRQSDYGSDEAFINAIIDVNVDVKINSIGGKTE